MSSTTPASSAVPPSPQEILRKLSLHSAPKANKLTPVSTTTTSTSTAPIPTGTTSDSDSDSLNTPDVGAPSPGLGGGFLIGNTAQPPLTSIAERHSASGGEDSDEEDEEGGWKAADAQGGHKASLEDLVLKAGYLWKKGERRKTWKKRWFVLRPSHLAYYKTAAEYQLLRLLELSDVHSCTPVSLKRHEHAFGLVSPIRTFYLQAKTADELSQWVKAIEEARQQWLSTSSGQTRGSSNPIPIPGSHPPPVRAIPSITPSPPSNTIHAYSVTSSDSEDTSSVQRSYSASSQTKPGVTSPAKTTGGGGSSTPMDTSKAILSGYLMKCGSKRQKWRKRWFVLTPEKLVYSASHMDTKPHRYFVIGEILDALEYDLPANRHNASLSSPINPPLSATSPPSETMVDSQQPFTFKIVTTRRTLLLCAPSEDDEIRWLGAVRALIARRSGAGAVPGDTGPKATTATTTVNSGGESGVTTPTPGGLRGKIRRLSTSGPTSTVEDK